MFTKDWKHAIDMMISTEFDTAKLCIKNSHTDERKDYYYKRVDATFNGMWTAVLWLSNGMQSEMLEYFTKQKNEAMREIYNMVYR